MPGILRGVFFPFKDMTQVSSTVGTQNLSTSAIAIRLSYHRSFDFIIKARPSAARLKFIFRPVKQGIAPVAMISPFFIKVILFPAEGSFRPFVDNNPFFFRRQCIRDLLVHYLFLLSTSNITVFFIRNTPFGDTDTFSCV
jgi:hypothetical protein